MTVEFTLVLPVSRRKIVTSKLLAALTNCTLFVVFTWLISVYSVRGYQPEQGFFNFLRLEMLAMFLLEMVFLSFGLMLGCISKSPRKVGSVAIGAILGLYFLRIFAGMNQKMEWLKWLTPFGWFNASEIFRSGQLEVLAIALTAVVVVVFLAFGYATYDKRDLYIETKPASKRKPAYISLSALFRVAQRAGFADNHLNLTDTAWLLDSLAMSLASTCAW